MPTTYWWDNVLQDAVRFEALERLDLVDANALQRLVLKYNEELLGGLMGHGAGCLTRPWVTYEYPSSLKGGMNGPYYVNIGPFQMYYSYEGRRSDGTPIVTTPPANAVFENGYWSSGGDPTKTNSMDDDGKEYTTIFNGTHYMPATPDNSGQYRGMVLSHDPEDAVQQAHSRVDITAVLQSNYNDFKDPVFGKAFKHFYIYARPAIVDSEEDARRKWSVTENTEVPTTIKTRKRTRIQFTVAQDTPSVPIDGDGFPTEPPWVKVATFGTGQLDMTFTGGTSLAPIDPSVYWISAFDTENNFEWTGEFQNGQVPFGAPRDNAGASNLLFFGGLDAGYIQSGVFGEKKDLGIIRLTHLIRRQIRAICFGNSPGVEPWYGTPSISLAYIKKWMNLVWFDFDGQEGSENGLGPSVNFDEDAGLLPSALSWGRYLMPFDDQWTTGDTNAFYPETYLHACGTVFLHGYDADEFGTGQGIYKIGFRGFGLEHVEGSTLYTWHQGGVWSPYSFMFRLATNNQYEPTEGVKYEGYTNHHEHIFDGHYPFEVIAIHATPTGNPHYWQGGNALGFKDLLPPNGTMNEESAANPNGEMDGTTKGRDWYKGSAKHGVHGEIDGIPAVGTPHVIFPLYNSDGSYDHRDFQIRTISHVIGPALSSEFLAMGEHLASDYFAAGDDFGETHTPNGPAHSHPGDTKKDVWSALKTFFKGFGTQGQPTAAGAWPHDTGMTTGRQKYPFHMYPLCSVSVWCRRKSKAKN